MRKSVVQLYAQAPYIEGGVEKSAIRLMDYEKTDVLEPGESVKVTLYVDMSNLASYDYEDAKTYILDAGTYYFAIGADSHDALNNILAAQGQSGMVGTDGLAAAGDADNVYSRTWSKDVTTFSTSVTGETITNRLTDGIYAMDINAFADQISGFEEVVYLSGSDWNGTFPETYGGFGIKSGTDLEKAMKNDFYTLETNEDTSDIVFGDTESDILRKRG